MSTTHDTPAGGRAAQIARLNQLAGLLERHPGLPVPRSFSVHTQNVVELAAAVKVSGRCDEVVHGKETYLVVQVPLAGEVGWPVHHVQSRLDEVRNVVDLAPGGVTPDEVAALRALAAVFPSVAALFDGRESVAA